MKAFEAILIRIRAFRPAELERASGVSRRTIERIRAGTTSPTVQLVGRLEAGLDLLEKEKKATTQK